MNARALRYCMAFVKKLYLSLEIIPCVTAVLRMSKGLLHFLQGALPGVGIGTCQRLGMPRLKTAYKQLLQSRRQYVIRRR
jgi:hypothetical protein